MNFLTENLIEIASLLTAVASLVLVLVLFVQFRKYRLRQQELWTGKGGEDLEERLLRHKRQLATHRKNLKELGEILEELVSKNRLNIQKAGVVRYNPFGEVGGDMSFTLALLNADDDGIVISSLHGREGTRVYAKAVKGGQSKNQLTEEEQQAIKEAGVMS